MLGAKQPPLFRLRTLFARHTAIFADSHYLGRKLLRVFGHFSEKLPAIVDPLWRSRR
jgi:hypothetical protein